MFIREVVKKRKGKKYFQHHLIESVRTPAGPRQILKLNLGRIKLEREKWKELANAIESELNNQMQLFSVDEEIQSLAQFYAKQIIKSEINKKSSATANSEKNTNQQSPKYEYVDINSINTSDALSIGIEHVVLSQMKCYKLDSILESIGFDDNHINYAKMLICGRIAHPASERETVRWLSENSAMLELLGTNIKIYDNALHRTAILMWKNYATIEKKLAKTAKKTFSLQENVILYDLTNTYFEGSKMDRTIAKPAKSKERRNDRPLVTLALTVDDDGFPKQSKILPGNVSEPETLEKMLDNLSEFYRDPDWLQLPRTVVIDAGIATESNLKLIQSKKYKYVAVSRKKSYKDDFWKDAVKNEIDLSQKNLTLKTKMVKKEKELFLLCSSKTKAIKEKAIFEKKIKKFEESLDSIVEGLKKKRTQKKYAKINERIGRLKEKYKVGNLYEITIKAKKDIVVDIQYKRNEQYVEKVDNLGEYVLRTNRLDLNAETISKIHRSLTVVEDSFRCMKSDLGLRPNYHKDDEHSSSHIFISVIAYHIAIGIMTKLKKKGINYKLSTIRNILSTHMRVTTAFTNNKNEVNYVRTTCSPNETQKKIYQVLNIKQKPLDRVHIKIPIKKTTSKSGTTK